MSISAKNAAGLAQSARDRGNLSEALEHYAEAARIYRSQNDLLAYAHTIRHSADIYRRASMDGKARPLYEEALELYRTNLDTKLLDLANTVRPYALLNEQEGNLDLARTLWEEARQLYSSLRIKAGVSECDSHLRNLPQS